MVDAVTRLPVAIISASKIGKRELINPTKLFTVSLIKIIILEKLVITSVTIKMYCT